MDLAETFKSIRAELGKLGIPWNFPPHLVWRLSAAVGDEDLQHVESDLAQTSHRIFSGTVMLFTETRVIRAVMTDGPDEPREQQAPTYSVQLATWSRATLRTLEFQPDKSSWRNSDNDWSGLNLTGAPAGFSVTLHYDGRDAVTLPLLGEYRQSERSAALFDFLPELLRDVSAG